MYNLIITADQARDIRNNVIEERNSRTLKKIQFIMEEIKQASEKGEYEYSFYFKVVETQYANVAMKVKFHKYNDEVFSTWDLLKCLSGLGYTVHFSRNNLTVRW